MGKFITLEHADVTKFSRTLNKKVQSKAVDDMFINIVDRGMENTITEAEKRTPVWTGELKKSWREDVEKAKRTGNTFSKTAINEAYNEEAAEVGMNPYYASFVEEGHKKVPWRKRTHGVHMLAEAEVDTERELQKIVDDEVKKMFGGLFD